MLKKLSGSKLVILLGVVLLIIGSIQPMRYETAKTDGYEVDAKIVAIEAVEDYDVVEEQDVTEYHIYVDYTVDGKEYTRVKAKETRSLENLWVGNTIKLVVNPDNPGSKMFEGGILATIGMLVTGFGILCTVSDRKKQKKVMAESTPQ